MQKGKQQLIQWLVGVCLDHKTWLWLRRRHRGLIAKRLGSGYFLPELTIELVKRYSGDDFGGISRNALYEQLDQLGFLASKDKDQNTKSIKVGGQKTRVLHLNTSALALADDGAESS